MRKQSDYSQQELRQLFRERGICVVIPTYNNVGSIQRVVTEAQQFCSDIIVVDDGSTDDTMATLRRKEAMVTSFTFMPSMSTCPSVAS